MKKRDLKNSKPRKAILKITLNHNMTLGLTKARNGLLKYSEKGFAWETEKFWPQRV